MSDDPNEFTSDQDGSSTGGTLRQKLEQALAQLSTLKAENETLKSKETERTTTTVWDELKVPAPIRGFYTGDKTPEAIKAWWDASRGFFNLEAGESEPQETEVQRSQR